MSRTFIQSLTRRAGFLLLTGAALGLLATGVSTKGLKFYSDDPISRAGIELFASEVLPYLQRDIPDRLWDRWPQHATTTSPH